MSPRETTWLTTSHVPCPHHPYLSQTQFFINWDWLHVLCGKGLSFNHFMLLKMFHFIKNQLIMLFEVISCFNYWFFSQFLWTGYLFCIENGFWCLWVCWWWFCERQFVTHVKTVLYCWTLEILQAVTEILVLTAGTFLSLQLHGLWLHFSSLWKTVWWPCVCRMKIRVITSCWYFKTYSVNLTDWGEL